MKLNFKRKKGLWRKISVWQYLALGYLLVILFGSVLLVLPCATAGGESTSYLDALFTATSATCVTGLVVYDTAIHWSVFGQVVILLLIQTGGLGFTTFVTILFMMIRRGVLGVYEKRTVMQSFGGNKFSGAGKLVLRVVVGTFVIEAIGALLLMIRFIPEFGAGRGIYFSVFHAVSAFCNAGFDLMGGVYGEFASLSHFQRDPLVCIVVPLLIIVGGLGFCVWGDVMDCRFRMKKTQFYTKFILLVNAILIALSTLLFLLFERNNPDFANFNFGERLLNSFFKATTTRTAGFFTTDWNNVSDSGYMLAVVLMFIGGCSGSTAGGIKVSTFAVIVMGMWGVLRGRRDINLGKRRIDSSLLGQALAIFTAYLFIILVATTLICAIEPGKNPSFQQILFETVSALGTVGLSMGITPGLSVGSKIIIILLMYMGRAGVLTLSLAIKRKGSEAEVRRPVAETLYIG